MTRSNRDRDLGFRVSGFRGDEIEQGPGFGV